ncbi:hypothetical protein TWF481_003218 [Arthrobotrys musiformis]|uniref:F-box domain-containing protein n=1 Tax=Arthrobotrys musiformis TaxID=47236 RepID=A0AAV9VPL2_9PEZI
MPHTLSTIPVELLNEILSYLSAPTLKFLRQAIPCRRILTTTAQILFHNFTIRLAASSGSVVRLEALLRKPPLSEPTEAESGYGGIFANVKTFVLDTRYPIVLHRNPGDLAAIKLGRAFLRESLPTLSSGAARRQTEALGTLVEVVEKLIAEGHRISTFSWLTSGSVPSGLHETLSSLLCSAVAERGYKLHVTLIVNSTTSLMHYCPQLSNLHRMVIRFIENTDIRNTYPLLDMDHSQCLSRLVLRSKDTLQHFMLDLRNVQTSPGTVRPLYTALEQATELRSLQTYALSGFTLDIDFTNLKKLVHIASAQSGTWNPTGGRDAYTDSYWCPEDGDSYQGRLFQRILDSDVKLERICAMNYGQAVHQFLLKNTSPITHIDLFGIFEENAELAGLFWEEVVPKYSATLKKIGVRFAEDKGAWTWKNAPETQVNNALSQCRNLDTLKICSTTTAGDHTSIIPMVESLAATCPKLSTIYIDFCCASTEQRAHDTRWQIIGWKDDSEKKVFQNRRLRIVFEARAGPCARADWPSVAKLGKIRQKLMSIYETDRLAEHTEMSLLYDTHFIEWNLSNRPYGLPGQPRFCSSERYRHDDGLEKVWGAYEEFLHYN